MGQFGTDELKKTVSTLADIVNVGSQVVGGSFLALLGLVTPIDAIRKTNLTELRNELLELDASERTDIEQTFVMRLHLANKTLEQKIAEAAELLNQAVDIVDEGIQTFEDAKALLAKFRTLIGV